MSPDPVHVLPREGSIVVVTGAAGYIGGWLVVKLLERGHTVRASVRDVNNDSKVGFLKAMPEIGGRLSLHAADMTVEGAYDKMFEGAHTVFHPAEVFMSFMFGRAGDAAEKDFGGEATAQALNEHALRSSRFLVDSINRTSTVRRLIYTSSIAAILPNFRDLIARPSVDETREPGAIKVGEHSYAITKRSTEHFFAYQASISGGRWSAIVANPSDVIGPVLAQHQAAESWQGKLAAILRGVPAEQELTGRPWLLVDARDVAEAEIRLAESPDVESGQRFMLTSGDTVFPEDLGPRIMELYPSYQCATTVAPPAQTKEVVRREPFWIRVHLRNDKVVNAIGMSFHSFDDTLRATVESLTTVGGITPNLK